MAERDRDKERKKATTATGDPPKGDPKGGKKPTAFRWTMDDMVRKATDIGVPWLTDMIVAAIPEQALDTVGKLTSHWADMVYALLIPNTIPGAKYIDDFRSRFITAIQERITKRQKGEWTGPQTRGLPGFPGGLGVALQAAGIDFSRLRAIPGEWWWELAEFRSSLSEELWPTYDRFLRGNLFRVVRSDSQPASSKSGGKGSGQTKAGEGKPEQTPKRESALDTDMEVIRSFVEASHGERLAQIRALHDLSGEGNGSKRIRTLRELVLTELKPTEQTEFLAWLDSQGEDRRRVVDFVNRLPSKEAQLAFLRIPAEERMKLVGPKAEDKTLTAMKDANSRMRSRIQAMKDGRN